MHTTHTRLTLTAFLLTAAASSALAQPTNITAANKFSWCENGGWMNWRDAGSPIGTQGGFLAGSFASGFVWMENLGWLNLGDGTPVNGVAYANATGADFGVNIDADGALSGLAWGENIGWFNFTLPNLPANQRPRLDKSTSRLRGYVWGENIGWINLDSSEEGKHVGVRTCAADFNGDGLLDPDDLSDFITCYFGELSMPASCAAANFNGDAGIDPDDLSDYITAFFSGCP